MPTPVQALKNRAIAGRLNGVTMRKGYWRDNLSTDSDGIAAAVAVRSFRTLTLTAEYERLVRRDIHGRARE